MGDLSLKTPLRFSYPLLSPTHPLPRFGRTLYVRTRSHGSLHLASRRRAWNRKLAAFCSITALSYSTSSAYGGWDEPGLDDGAEEALGKLEAFRNLFVAMGVADGKYAVLFCLGFVSALAVSRVRVWALALLPFCGLVFASGVLVGFARGGVASDLLSLIRRNRDGVKLSHEKMEDFGELLEELCSKMSELKICLQRFVDLNPVESGEVKGYLDVLSSVSLATTPLKKIVEDFMEVYHHSGPMGEDHESETKFNAKSNKKRTEVGMLGVDILQYLIATFQDVIVGRDPQKTKSNGIRKEAVERLGSKDPSFKAAVATVEGRTLANKEKQVLMPTGNQEDGKVSPLRKESFDDRPIVSATSSGTIKLHSTENRSPVINTRSPNSSADSTESRNSSFYSTDDCRDHDVLPDKEDFHILNRDFRLMSMQGSYRKVVLEHQSHKTEIARQQSQVGERSESRFDSRVQEDEMVSFSSAAETSLKSTKISELYDKAYLHTNDRINSKVRSERTSRTTGFRDEAKKLETQTVLDNQCSKNDIEAKKKASASETATAMASAEEEFNHIVKHGVDLLRQAGECLKGKNDEKAAEILLYRSTRLLSTAVSMKPGNLLALGQLGNNCLLHGELKLKMSRDLRTLLSKDDPPLTRKQSGERSNQLNIEKVASVLFDVCEECEELLIEAGRNYKLVLSYDKSDAKALYNWGLALSFRAQLIADIGPDAAFDADKVYLAAIEKFDAMLSRSNDYVPDALFRWGMALWQRSHLRPRDSSEKIKLLQQAKTLFEDVLQVDSDNPKVHEALRSCTSELSFGRCLE